MKVNRITIYVPDGVRYFEENSEVRKAGEENATARVLRVETKMFRRVVVKLSNGETLRFFGFPFITS